MHNMMSSIDCDTCGEFYQILQQFEKQMVDSVQNDGYSILTKHQLTVLYQYLALWAQRQCLCIYRDRRNAERFAMVIQCVICLSVNQLKRLLSPTQTSPSSPSKTSAVAAENWSLEELERLFQFVAKIFILHFPLYAGPKQALIASGHRFEPLNVDVSTGEMSHLAIFCDVHDATIDFPLSVLRNVALFCNNGGLLCMANVFRHAIDKKISLSSSLAHALISVLCNVKLWLNFRAMRQLFMPVRLSALKYMSNLDDAELRSQSARHMAEFLWSCIKDNPDAPLGFDQEGLDLAFKFFSSSTLTMRLAGIAQINSHITLFNEMCHTESAVDVETVGLQLALWVLQNRIVESIFGPNMHVEIIKQSHALLNFLAYEGKLCDDHISVVWQAAQLKHCSKPVHDLILSLLKNLEADPIMHLYDLLKELPVKDHTQQTIHLAQILQKMIWSSCGSFNHLLHDVANGGTAYCDEEEEEDDDEDEEEEDEMEDVKSIKNSPGAATEIANKSLLNLASGPSLCFRPSHSSNSSEHGSEDDDDELEEEELINSDVNDEDMLVDEEDDYSECDEEEVEHQEAERRETVVNDGEEAEINSDPISLAAGCTDSVDGASSNHAVVKKSAFSSPVNNGRTQEINSTRQQQRVLDVATVWKRQFNKHNAILDDIPGGFLLMDNDADVQTVMHVKNNIKRRQKKGLKVIDVSSENEDDCGIKKRRFNSPPSNSMSSPPPISSRLHSLALHPWWGTDVHAAVAGGAGRSTAMVELANLVKAHNPVADITSYDMRPLIMRSGGRRYRHSESPLESGSGSESVSSHFSDKNHHLPGGLEDNQVDEDDAPSHDIGLILQQHHQYSQMASMYHQKMVATEQHQQKPSITRQQRQHYRILARYKIDTVCEPGSMLLWDLLQNRNIHNLSDGLALDAERALVNLLCVNLDRSIRLKFIQGCLNNISNNESCCIALRLVPKLLQSFHGFQILDTYDVCMYVEKKFDMMNIFFKNLQIYTEEHARSEKCTHFSHASQIKVRLQFLSVVFATSVSPIEFRLSQEHIRILWECLASDEECSDELYQWLLMQMHSKEQHAICLEGFKLIYHEKIPSLKCENISIMGLNMFFQLCQLAKIAARSGCSSDDPNETFNMDQLWKIALCAKSTDVSLKAIQYLNTTYFGQGKQFLSTCMKSLQLASQDIGTGSEDVLVRIQRALLLLKTYLESFRRRYAYYFRRLSIAGQGVSTHAELMEWHTSEILRVVVQASSHLDAKIVLCMRTSDLVADLRAEIASWWESKFAPIRQVTLNLFSPNHSLLRIITQGHEITDDSDEKTLIEIGLRDLQLVLVSQGITRPMMQPAITANKANVRVSSSEVPPFSDQDQNPINIMLQTEHFDQFFSLMESLCSLKKEARDKAQIMSRRVWDILMLLPTNEDLMHKLQFINDINEKELQEILDSSSRQKLMYVLYIVDWLGRPYVRRRRLSINLEENEIVDGDFDDHESDWVKSFVRVGGLRVLVRIFVSGGLQLSSSGNVCEWGQDCLCILLKLLLQFGVESDDIKTNDQAISFDVAQTKKQRGIKHFKVIIGGERRPNIPRLTPSILDLMHPNSVMIHLTDVMLALCSRDSSQYKTGLFGRAQVVHFAMNFLVAWLFSGDEMKSIFFENFDLQIWLKKLLLDDYDPSVRREICTGIYKLCIGSTTTGQNGTVCTLPMLGVLFKFLDDAMMMKPLNPSYDDGVGEDGKETYGPACRDYFWIYVRLVENLQEDDIDSIDLDKICHCLANGLLSRKLFEKRRGDVLPDDGLVGILNLLCAIMKHNPSYKCSLEGQGFLLDLFECLFALPSSREKDLPRCKSSASRQACYDVLVEMTDGSLPNYMVLHAKLLEQHQQHAHKPYPWEYWPRDDGRSECGYVGLTNLGATCYMASCIQQLFMIPQARFSIISATKHEDEIDSKHASTLYELQRMFAYMSLSERKAYNPISFCKIYEMDHQSLNTGEQKDMAEFFIDLLSKMEEMTSDLKNVTKRLFCGTLTNNVVSMDCDHVSRTVEEFYTVRCQVAEMRSLSQSLEEVTVQDILVGDNMYTCSQCNKKVRAEKRACFKRLPQILAFNTMRYTFNMITMLKEKVNTHFSFPLLLDMTPYMEHILIPEDKRSLEQHQPEQDGGLIYELIGVTVHTGTADGGHYYAFIRDRSSGGGRDNWYSFNDAEVKSFDSSQIGAECFGGEVNSRSYDQVTDKFMDMSIEKNNSAYMLFYERLPTSEASTSATEKSPTNNISQFNSQFDVKLSPELEEWIRLDNMNFIRDNIMFDHNYFNFMWQMVSSVPTTLGQLSSEEDITLLSAKLSTSFFLECFIHAKEKLNVVQWVEHLTKQFDSSATACCWFFDCMASDPNWPVTIFLKCQVATIRQIFHRLCIHVLQKLRPTQVGGYLLPSSYETQNADKHPSDEIRAKIGDHLPITRFVRMLLKLLSSGSARPHIKYVTELFRFLFDFGKMGETEARFLLQLNTISIYVDFYLKTIKNDVSNTSATTSVSDMGTSEDEDDEDVVNLAAPVITSSLTNESNKAASLERMVHLIAILVEWSRTPEDGFIHLSPADMASLTGGKNLSFLYNITKDNISIGHTCNLIVSLTRNNPGLSEKVAAMVFYGIKQPDYSMHFFKLLTMLTELSVEPPGTPCYTSLVMHKVWDLTKICPLPSLDWLCLQVIRNQCVRSWLISSLESWVPDFLIRSPSVKVRNLAAFLIVSLVSTPHFRQSFRKTVRSSPIILSTSDTHIVHQILIVLFGLFPLARQYATDLPTHNTSRLVSYFHTMSHFLVSRTEKLLFHPYFHNLWKLFHPKLSEPAIPVHLNKQALLNFWFSVCQDCPENVKLILRSAHVVKNIGFTYILADHEDSDVINYNKVMLPSYYGLLRLCCVQSRAFTRRLACHQNIQWAFRNITPYPTQYPLACEELFKLMNIFLQKCSSEDDGVEEDEDILLAVMGSETEDRLLDGGDGSSSSSSAGSCDGSDMKSTYTSTVAGCKSIIQSTGCPKSEEEDSIRNFRHQTLNMYLSIIDGRTSWNTLITVLRILVENNEDRMIVVYNNGLGLIFDALSVLHVMFYEATACHMTGDLLQLLGIFLDLLKALRDQSCSSYEIRQLLSRWKDMSDMTINMLTLCNSFTPHDLHDVCISCIKEMLMLWPSEMLGILVPEIKKSHANSTDDAHTTVLGPYFPRKSPNSGKQFNSSLRPAKRLLQMWIPLSQLEAAFGEDPEYDKALHLYFVHYNGLIDLMVRLAVNAGSTSKELIDLSSTVGLNGVPLHFALFPKLWTDIHDTPQIDRKVIRMLIASPSFLKYVDAVLFNERSSLNNQFIHKFLRIFFPKVSSRILTHSVLNTISQLVKTFTDVFLNFPLERLKPVLQLNGDLRALYLFHQAQEHESNILSTELLKALEILRKRILCQLGNISAITLEESNNTVNKTCVTPSDQDNIEPSSIDTTKVMVTSSAISTASDSCCGGDSSITSIQPQQSKLTEACGQVLKSLNILLDAKKCSVVQTTAAVATSSDQLLSSLSPPSLAS